MSHTKKVKYLKNFNLQLLNFKYKNTKFDIIFFSNLDSEYFYNNFQKLKIETFEKINNFIN